MTTALRIILRAEPTGASTFSATHLIQTEAYQTIALSLAAADGTTPTTLTVDVQPGEAGQVQFVMITADPYPPPAEDGTARLTYAVDGGDPIALDAPLLVMGRGIGELLGDVKQLVFSNRFDREVALRIAVARDATPS